MTAEPPRRIQQRRAKGWRKPEGAIVVARPTRWGNPFAPILETGSGRWRITCGVPGGRVLLGERVYDDRVAAVGAVVDMYRTMIREAAEDQGQTPAEYLAVLAGHDLACWCPLDQPCHADVLLELANQEADRP